MYNSARPTRMLMYINNFVVFTGEKPKTCCSTSQLIDLNTNMAQPRQFLSRCPSCIDNFINLYCYFTCSPYQSDYMLPKETVSYKNKMAITKIDYAVSHDYAYGMYNSCKDVQMPSNNQKAIGALCGKESKDCTPENWLKFMGDKSLNPFTPFTINFNVSKSSYMDGNVTLKPMNETIDSCKRKCSCQDCEESCGEPLPPIKPQAPWEIIGIDGLTFVASLLYIIFILIFGTYLIWSHLVFRNPSEYEPQTAHPNTNGVNINGTVHIFDGEPSCFERNGARMEHKLESIFGAWGRFCSRRPIIVIVVGVCLCAILIGGISVFQVTTDPVELWSAPDSRARTEKKYFDEHFRSVV